MERRVNFSDGLDLSPDDFNNLQDFARQSFDHMVGDAITSERKYAGLATAKATDLTIQTQPGRFYDAGKVYYRDTVMDYDFTPDLPVANRKVCLLVAWGEEIKTGETPREILIDADTLTTESQLTQMETQRALRLSIVKGAESPDPLPPAVAAGYTAVAQIVLSVNGVDSVAMVDANKLDSAAGNATRLKKLETFQADIEPKVAGLAGDIAALSAGQRNLVNVEQYSRVLVRLADLEGGNGVPEAAVDSFADFLLDESASDPAFADYAATVQEGIRLPEAGSATPALALKNPLDPNAKVSNGVLLPAYTEEVRFSTGDPTGQVKLNGYSYAVNSMVQKTLARFRLRHGPWRRLSSSIPFLKSGATDLLATVFSKDGEAIVTTAALQAQLVRDHEFRRRDFHWVDKVELAYWEQVTVDHEVNGTVVAETFLQANDTIMTALRLPFPQLGADGAVTVVICETEHGVARLDKVIAKTTVDRADLETGWNDIPFQPTFLEGGTRYAFVVVTAGDHYIGTVEGTVYPQGTFFYVLDGQYQQGDGTKDIAFELVGAAFTQSRAVIDLADVALLDGIADIDLIAQAVTPESCAMTFYAQIGGIWYPLADGESSPLVQGGALQNLLPLRVVMTGTPEVMPMLGLTDSQLKVSRPALALKWVSAIRNLPGAGSSEIRATFRLENFDAVHHTLTPTLLTGAGYATVEAADSTSDVTLADGSIERTAVWSLGAAVTDFRIQLDGTTDSALIPFHVAFRRDYAL
ncbi:MAG: hypothetical protein PHE36_09300 [Novosphingobium sp.]|nr:hypothetical protein [Novosphingobium sp.]